MLSVVGWTLDIVYLSLAFPAMYQALGVWEGNEKMIRDTLFLSYDWQSSHKKLANTAEK